MCTTCGCSGDAQATVSDPATGEMHAVAEHAHSHHHHGHSHAHGHGDEHADADGNTHGKHEPVHGRQISLEQDVLAKNNGIAQRNRGWFEGRGILALNLVSSPGAGKTTLLERTILDVRDTLPISVIEGDQETTFDAERIRATGCRSVQVNTGTGCHLDAEMIASALRDLEPPLDSLLMIENVGNLVCPALFDLGERAKVAILSVTEGTDKPLKYPHMFRASTVMIVNKVDLLPYVDFDMERCIGFAKRVNPDIGVLQVSATRGDGMDEWYHWLQGRMASRAIEVAS